MKTYKDAYSGHNAALLQVKPPMDDIYMLPPAMLIIGAWLLCKWK